MKIWISQRAQKGGYAVQLLARMAGILVLAVVLAVLGGIAPLVFGWPRELSMCRPRRPVSRTSST